MTPSEIYIAYENGCSLLKLFPVSSIGGVSFLKAVQSPYAHLQLQFIPMGGINLHNMQDYLELKNVIAVGGSWLASEDLMKRNDYAAIEKNTRDALQLSKNDVN
jgi:2-dehydro-3-deoxyphosphogluconate aldolase/(4S)-4-hydroxy-2-oxoglutarate aldolase